MKIECKITKEIKDLFQMAAAYKALSINLLEGILKAPCKTQKDAENMLEIAGMISKKETHYRSKAWKQVFKLFPNLEDGSYNYDHVREKLYYNEN